jgi:hypothetical protein
MTMLHLSASYSSSAVEWLRVVLDEAHHCKSRISKTARAVYALQARRRWQLRVGGEKIADSYFSIIARRHTDCQPAGRSIFSSVCVVFSPSTDLSSLPLQQIS